MEFKQIKELMAAMGRTGTKKLSLEKEDFKLTLEREDNGNFRGLELGIDGLEENPMRGDIERHRAAMPLMRNDSGQMAQKSPPAAEKEDAPGNYVTSPMVGTFYLSPSPSDPTFVNVGDKVEKNSPVCIIEAMKVMNEIKAGVAGTIAEILVENGHPVEFGTKLFRIV